MIATNDGFLKYKAEASLHDGGRRSVSSFRGHLIRCRYGDGPKTEEKGIIEASMKQVDAGAS